MIEFLVAKLGSMLIGFNDGSQFLHLFFQNFIAKGALDSACGEADIIEDDSQFSSICDFSTNRAVISPLQMLL